MEKKNRSLPTSSESLCRWQLYMKSYLVFYGSILYKVFKLKLFMTLFYYFYLNGDQTK